MQVTKDMVEKPDAGWTAWLQRGRLGEVLGVASGSSQLARALAKGEHKGRRIETLEIDEADRKALGFAPMTRCLYRIELEQVGAIEDEPELELEPAPVQAPEADKPIWTQIGARPQLSSDAYQALTAELASVKDELEEWKELAQRSADELAEMRAQETFEASVMREAITALERERDEALEHARNAENERVEALKERNKAEDERDEARALRDEASKALAGAHRRATDAEAERDQAREDLRLAYVDRAALSIKTVDERVDLRVERDAAMKTARAAKRALEAVIEAWVLVHGSEEAA